MKDESVSDALLRQFLLDKLDEEERERIESLFLTDSAVRDRVLAAEQDLIEDYLEGSLSSSEREAFVLRYAQTAEQQRKLRITRSIKDWAIAEDAARGVEPVRSRGFRSTWSRPVFMVPVAAIVILAVVLAVVWANRRMEQSALAQEIARLNDPATLSAVPPATDAWLLKPGTLRSEGERPLKIPAGAATVEFHLIWQEREFPNYEALLRRFSDDRVVGIPDLSPPDAGRIIRLRLPTSFLSKGLYRVQVRGIAADAETSAVAEYHFNVVD